MSGEYSSSFDRLNLLIPPLDSRSSFRHTSLMALAQKISKRFSKMHMPPSAKTRPSSRQKRHETGRQSVLSTRSTVSHTNNAKPPLRPKFKLSRLEETLWQMLTTRTTSRCMHSIVGFGYVCNRPTLAIAMPSFMIAFHIIVPSAG